MHHWQDVHHNMVSVCLYSVLVSVCRDVPDMSLVEAGPALTQLSRHYVVLTPALIPVTGLDTGL